MAPVPLKPCLNPDAHNPKTVGGAPYPPPTLARVDRVGILDLEGEVSRGLDTVIARHICAGTNRVGGLIAIERVALNDLVGCSRPESGACRDKAKRHSDAETAGQPPQGPNSSVVAAEAGDGLLLDELVGAAPDSTPNSDNSGGVSRARTGCG